MFLSRRSSAVNDDNSEYEVDEFDETLDNSIRGRISRIARIVKGNRSASDIRAAALRIPQKWIVEPNNRRYSWWTKFILLWAVYSSFFTPLEFGFYRGLPRGLWVADITVQFVFLADIIVTFFVGYKNKKTYRLVSDFKSIALRYARTDFVWDFLACLPWDTIYKASGRKEEVRFLVWTRIYRVRKITGFLESLEKDIRFNYFATRILKLLFVELYSTHIAACLFYYLATTVPAAREQETWIGSLELGDRSYHDFRHIDLGTSYITSLYWAILTMSTVGYGDVHAVSTREMIFIILFVSADMILGAYLIGNMTALIVKGSETEKFRDKMSQLIKFMNGNHFNKDLRQQMKNHVRLQFESNLAGGSIIEDLPLSIRAKIAQELYRETVERVPLLKGCTSEFINQIVSRVREEYFLPGEVILAQRDAADQLYFVVHGVLEETVVADDGENMIISQLDQYSVFGEVAVLCNVPQPHTVRVVQLCKLLRLDKESLTNLLQLYDLDGRQIIKNLVVGKESDYRLQRSAADIKYLMSKQEAEAALMLNHASFQGDLSQLKQLIKAGADPSGTDYSGRTALHLAAFKGYEDIVRFLISENAAVNSLDRNGISPLLEALKGGNDHTAEVLYDKGARLLLQDAGPFLCSTAMSGDIELLKRLLAYGAEPNSTDYDLRTALHVAACEGLHLIVSVLLGAGADINAKDRWGNTPLDDAKRADCKTVVSLLEMAQSDTQSGMPSLGPHGTGQSAGSPKDSDSIAAATARKKEFVALLERVRSSKDWSSSPVGGERSMQRLENLQVSASMLDHQEPQVDDKLHTPSSKYNSVKEPQFDEDPQRGNNMLEIVECASGGDSRRYSSPRNRATNEDVLAVRKPVPNTYVSRKRVTIFPYHPWIPEETRTSGVVIWTPRTIEELLEMGVEQFGGRRSFILNSDGGEIRCVDFVADGDRLFIVDSLQPSHYKNE